MKTWRRKALMERRFVRWIFGIARSSSILAEVDRGSGVLEEAQMLGSKAAEVGFDWEYAVDALSKVREEVEEVQELLSSTETVDRGELAAEIGDLLFAVVNVSRKLELDAG
ncbi:MAG: MazG nucleotide pyrophosphohydrolase domain-containing protein, partial [Bradymonadaceae bacterium]